jgi:hypothetical protein
MSNPSLKSKLLKLTELRQQYYPELGKILMTDEQGNRTFLS